MSIRFETGPSIRGSKDPRARLREPSHRESRGLAALAEDEPPAARAEVVVEAVQVQVAPVNAPVRDRRAPAAVLTLPTGRDDERVVHLEVGVLGQELQAAAGTAEQPVAHRLELLHGLLARDHILKVVLVDLPVVLVGSHGLQREVRLVEVGIHPSLAARREEFGEGLGRGLHRLLRDEAGDLDERALAVGRGEAVDVLVRAAGAPDFGHEVREEPCHESGTGNDR